MDVPDVPVARARLKALRREMNSVSLILGTLTATGMAATDAPLASETKQYVSDLQERQARILREQIYYKAVIIAHDSDNDDLTATTIDPPPWLLPANHDRSHSAGEEEEEEEEEEDQHHESPHQPLPTPQTDPSTLEEKSVCRERVCEVESLAERDDSTQLSGSTALPEEGSPHATELSVDAAHVLWGFSIAMTFLLIPEVFDLLRHAWLRNHTRGSAICQHPPSPTPASQRSSLPHTRPGTPRVESSAVGVPGNTRLLLSVIQLRSACQVIQSTSSRGVPPGFRCAGLSGELTSSLTVERRGRHEHDTLECPPTELPATFCTLPGARPDDDGTSKMNVLATVTEFQQPDGRRGLQVRCRVTLQTFGPGVLPRADWSAELPPFIVVADYADLRTHDASPTAGDNPTQEDGRMPMGAPTASNHVDAASAEEDPEIDPVIVVR